MQKLVMNVDLMIEEHHPEADNAVQYWTSHKYGGLLLTENEDVASITAFDDNGNVIGKDLYEAKNADEVHELLGHVFTAKGDEYAAVSDDYSVNKRDFDKLWS